MITNQKMLLVKSTWYDPEKSATNPSFKLIALTNDCPYLEGNYIPHEGRLLMLHREKMTNPTMLYALDSKGDYIRDKKDPKKFHQERRLIDVPFETSLRNEEAINKFLQVICGETVNLQDYTPKVETKIEEKKETKLTIKK